MIRGFQDLAVAHAHLFAHHLLDKLGLDVDVDLLLDPLADALSRVDDLVLEEHHVNHGLHDLQLDLCLFLFFDQLLHMALLLELADQVGDDLWADPQLLSHIFPAVLLHQDLVDDGDLVLRRQRLTFSTPIPGHGRRVLDEVSEEGILQVLLAFEVAATHAFCKLRDVVDVLLEPERILPMLLQRLLSETFSHLREPLPQVFQPLRVDDVVIHLHSRMFFGKHFRVEVRLPLIM